MTTFPGSPRLLKGAIIGEDPTNVLARPIVFQYNPDTLRRRLEQHVTQRVNGKECKSCNNNRAGESA